MKVEDDWKTFYVVSGKNEHLVLKHQMFKDLNEAAKSLNEREIKRKEQKVSSMEHYVEWQNKRMANWKPKELKEVKK